MIKIVLLLLSVSYAAHALTASEIIDKMEDNQTSKTSISTMTQVVHQSSGKVVTSKLKSYSQKEGEESLMEYTYPKRINGMKILSLDDGDEIWMFSPRTKRTRKISGSSRKNGVNGSDFSYDDMNTKDYDDDYTMTKLADEDYSGTSHYKIEGIKKNKDLSYSKVVMLINKETFISSKIDMYDEDGKLWKILVMEGVEKKGKYFTAKKITMTNVQKNTKTEMLTESIEFDVDVDENMFSQKYLKR